MNKSAKINKTIYDNYLKSIKSQKEIIKPEVHKTGESLVDITEKLISTSFKDKQQLKDKQRK